MSALDDNPGHRCPAPRQACNECHCTETPQWRHCGGQLLCNACGIKALRQERRAQHAAAGEEGSRGSSSKAPKTGAGDSPRTPNGQPASPFDRLETPPQPAAPPAEAGAPAAATPSPPLAPFSTTLDELLDMPLDLLDLSYPDFLGSTGLQAPALPPALLQPRPQLQPEQPPEPEPTLLLQQQQLTPAMGLTPPQTAPQFSDFELFSALALLEEQPGPPASPPPLLSTAASEPVLLSPNSSLDPPANQVR